ncbi:unnamed protein product [Caenorhabditis auriculariae]|uniref:Uncharacterized protein n=1 Tax=Caenorhabditis auriculariae TaxID=2777116 RepID=A0A8S1GWL1_9PELO|nr:unnamed protein product [Caenorhabditis auriculariae]
MCSVVYSLLPIQKRQIARMPALLLIIFEMSSAEELAAEYEKDGGPEFSATGGNKRSKAERVEHKHSSQPGGDTRKVVQTAINGENKRKEQAK